MRLTAVSAFVAASLGVSPAFAQYLINELSFGYSGRVSPVEAPGTLPNYAISGSPIQPDIYSNKIVLTPVAPGNQRSSLWAQKPMYHTGWTADIEFRASGPERGGGNLNLWLASQGESQVGTNSVYTVGKFDGLALVVDSHGGSAGMVRGFLNDGTVDYSQHHNVDELAFGHCAYSYRNLGRPSQLKVRQTGEAFRVEIDGAVCFESDKFSIPSGYSWGLTAATPDTPDSFEIYKVTVMSELSQEGNHRAAPPPPVDQQQAMGGQAGTGGAAFDNQLDQDAELFTTSKAQFADLHNRLQSSRSQMLSIWQAVSDQKTVSEQRHQELKDMMVELKRDLGSRMDQMGDLVRRVESLEQETRSMRNDLGNKIQANERSFERYLKSHHSTLSDLVTTSAPTHNKLIIIFVGTQVVFAVAYVIYKRRKQDYSKKYL